MQMTTITVPAEFVAIINRLIVAFTSEPGPALVPAPVAPPVAAPARKLPYFPQPADFQDETVIGHIAGAPVIGHIAWDNEQGRARNYDTRVELDGMTIWCDEERLQVEDGSYDGWKIESFGRLIELRQMGELDRLIALARRWCAA